MLPFSNVGIRSGRPRWGAEASKQGGCNASSADAVVAHLCFPVLSFLPHFWFPLPRCCHCSSCSYFYARCCYLAVLVSVHIGQACADTDRTVEAKLPWDSYHRAGSIQSSD